MIDEALLRTVGTLFGASAALAAVVWLAHSAWATLVAQREARARPAALHALAGALHGGETAPALAQLDRLGALSSISALIEMARTVAGEQRDRLDAIAREWGVLDHAESWAASRRWSRRLRAARLIALFGTGEERSGEALLDDADADVRAQAAEWAGGHPSPARIKRLAKMLGDPERRCRFAAREALVDAGRGAIVELDTALGRVHGIAAVGALEAARELAVPDFLPDAIGLMTAPDPAVRARAASLAAAIGGPEAVESLVLMLGDGDPEARAAAATGLGHLGRWEQAASVAGLLGDPEWRVRRAAALALRRMGPTGELLLRREGRAGEGPATDTARSALELPPAGASEQAEQPA
ncbi:MAG TPA: HEAT repeat domain-containing protein [Solirubrobacterales bacterium]